ncbi:hypothetical protein ACFSC4_22840 [Deinococcus malanensis]|uniref:hypothetical protein n=1 Tax=Deinococcus malanensis TaxID=1706855 RepID=UPI003626CA01
MTSPLRMEPFFVFWKNCPLEVIAPMVESFSQFAGTVTRGVTPLVFQVCLRTPFIAKPTSPR